MLPTDEYAGIAETTVFGSRAATAQAGGLLGNELSVFFGTSSLTIPVFGGETLDGAMAVHWVFGPTPLPQRANASSSARVTLTYGFTPVPEPACAWPLLIFLAIGVACKRRACEATVGS